MLWEKPMTDNSALEAALRRVMRAPDADGKAAERIARRFEPDGLPPQQRPLVRWPAALTDFTFAPAWPRVAALACAAMLGISIGLSGLGTRIAADLDLVRVAAADDGGNNVFDLDMGFRP
jgi:hypothetical protein